MSTEFADADEIHYVGAYLGTVQANNDPQKLGRCRVTVPGLIEPFSAWAFPMSTVGGGSANRGFFSVPEVGADVLVFFVQGDTDLPVYMPAHWGVLDGSPETPQIVQEMDATDAPKLKVFETGRFQMVWDGRDGELKWFILDKTSGDTIEIATPMA